MGLFEKLLYGSYEAMLINEIMERSVPSHVAIIMDGNRRFAQKYGFERYYGHFKGADTTEKVIDWSFDLGIKQLTIYAFSTENFSRSEEETDQLFELISNKLDEICRDERTHNRRMKVKIIGDIDRLPEKLQFTIRRAEEMTKNYDGIYLNVALAYGGRQELTDAVRSIAYKIKNHELSINDVNEDTITNNLYISNESVPYVDLIIRTGGNERISNFLPWQANGNECAAYFCAPFWPEFRKIDFLRAIRTYQRREYEKNKDIIRRIISMMSYYGKVELDDVVRVSRRVLVLPKKQVMRIINDMMLFR